MWSEASFNHFGARELHNEAALPIQPGTGLLFLCCYRTQLYNVSIVSLWWFWLHTVMLPLTCHISAKKKKLAMRTSTVFASAAQRALVTFFLGYVCLVPVFMRLLCYIVLLCFAKQVGVASHRPGALPEV